MWPEPVITLTLKSTIIPTLKQRRDSDIFDCSRLEGNQVERLNQNRIALTNQRGLRRRCAEFGRGFRVPRFGPLFSTIGAR